MKKVFGVIVRVLVLLAVLVPGIAMAQTLLVSSGSNTIRKFALSGQDLGIFASGLNSPDGLAFDRAGNLYVANVFSSNIREFSSTGQDLGIFASIGVNEPLSLAFDSDGNLFVSNDADNSIHKLSPSGQDLGLFVSLLGVGCPSGLAFSRSGNLLVADLCDSVIREYSPTGEDLGIFASAGLSNPGDFAIDATGNVFVSNTDNGGEFRNTIHKFSPTGQDLGIFASTGLRSPAGLAFDPLGNLLVANSEQRPGNINYSIRKFSPTGEDLGDLAILSDQPRDLAITPFCTTPPVITLSATPRSLWPPNGKMVPITVSGTITDPGCTIKTAAYAVIDEYGDIQPSGPVTLGAEGVYSFIVWLQASRLGTDLDGRLYIVAVGASNDAGMTGSKIAKVIVPHDQRH